MPPLPSGRPKPSPLEEQRVLEQMKGGGNGTITKLPALLQNKSFTRDDSQGLPHFSNSQLGMYLRCGKQYEYRYIKGIKTPPQMKLGSGKAIHNVFETNSKVKMTSGDDMPIADMLDHAATEHDKQMQDVEDETPKTIAKDKDASISIAGHYRRIYAPAITPLAAEWGFTIELDDDELGTDYLPVIGFVDASSVLPDPRKGPTEGQPIIAMEDYKKTWQRKGQLEVDVNTQLTLYDYAFNLKTGRLPDVIGLRQLGVGGPRSQKPGPFAELVLRSPAQMAPEVRGNRHKRVLNQMKAAQRAIRQGVFIPTDDPKTCSWCGYREDCQDKVV